MDDARVWASSSRLAGGEVALAAPMGVLVALLVAWRETTFRVDRRRGLLLVTQWGPLRSTWAREFSLASVAGVVEQRQGARRSIEVVLADDVLVPVAGARGADAGELDRVAREVSEVSAFSIAAQAE